MTTAELKDRILDAMIDPWNHSHDDFQHLTLAECRTTLADCREMEDSADLDESERLPADLTADTFRTLWNEIVDEYWEDKRESLRKYLLGEGNYEYTANKYSEAYYMRNNEYPHGWIYTQDDTEFCGYHNEDAPWSLGQFAKLVRGSRRYDANAPFFRYDLGELISAKKVFPDLIDTDEVIDYIIAYHDDLDVCEITDILDGEV